MGSRDKISNIFSVLEMKHKKQYRLAKCDKVTLCSKPEYIVNIAGYPLPKCNYGYLKEK